MGNCDCSQIPATREWCRSLPKAELHAHLSGSVRTKAIRRLLNRPGNDELRKRAGSLPDLDTGRTLKQCFELFPIIHDLITDKETLHEVVLEVLQDFASENTVYLELRTTPRESEYFSAEDYLWTVLQGVHAYHQHNPDGLACRILVSISRHLPVKDARKAVAITGDIIAKMKGTGMSGLIVGMELSGNPHKGLWKDFEPIFQDVRARLKLPISLHFGEVKNDEEAMAMLDFKPERIGHAVLMSERVADRLVQKERAIGLEVCITSNLMTNSAPSVKQHPVVTHFIPAKHQFCLCTDDSGVFGTTLSAEYGRLLECQTMTRQQVTDIALRGLQLWFCKDIAIKRRLHERFYSLLQEACSASSGQCRILSCLRSKPARQSQFG